MKKNIDSPCKEIQDALHADPANSQEPPESWKLHIKECAACQVEMQAARRMVEMLQDAGSAFELHAEPESLAREAIRKAALRTPSGRPGLRLLKPAIALGVVLAVALGGAGIWRFFLRGGSAGRTGQETRKEIAAETFAVVSAERIARSGARQKLNLDSAAAATGDDEKILLIFSDGTRALLSEQSRLRLPGANVRGLHLEEGTVALDVVRQAGLPPLDIRTPDGVAHVVGTRLFVRVFGGVTIVGVVRGRVVAESESQKIDVTAGSEALLRRGKAPLLQAAAGFGEAMEWAQEPAQNTDTTGFGTLRARKPGAAQNTEQALRLSERKVDVRIQGRIARTEIEEEFHNDSAETLEGIYTFPLPADAQVAALDLEVDGKWEHGAIVEKQRGDRIWAGVIRNAAPKAQKKEIVEYVWVPGPWHDPALLNWKKGSEFEMKIFPIPARGARRVRIAYTQVLSPVPGGWRYVLPLPSGQEVRAGMFRFSAMIGGFADASLLRVYPYALRKKTENGTAKLEWDASGFTPEGDLVMDIPETDPDREIRAWAYRRESAKPGTPEDFGMIALRPRLPLYTKNEKLEWIFVVDRSWSAQKARIQRAADVVARLVENVDGAHHVQVWACHHACSRVQERTAASAGAASAIRSGVGALEPVGSTSMDAVLDMLEKTVRETGAAPEQVRVVYFGDGQVTTGETQPAKLAEKLRQKLGKTRLSTVGLGGSMDEKMLRMLAQAGHGAMITVNQGENDSALSWRVLRPQLGVALENARIQLPEGAREITPEKMDTLWPGDEILLAFRMDRAVSGDVVLSGTIDGVPLERRYTVEMTPQAGNAFVPRLWAQGRIQDLEARPGAPEIAREIVKISRDFHVLSRYTSLLVLESPAMAKAFGVEDTRPKVDWTGLEAVQESRAQDPGMLEGGGGGGGDDLEELERATTAKSMPAPMSAPSRPNPGKMDEAVLEEMPRLSQPPRRRMILMRKVWYRKAAIVETVDSEASWAELQRKKAQYEQNPESRDRLKSLAQAYLAAGQWEEAQKLADRWLQKDAMDVEALLLQADIAFLRGNAPRAVDWLESAVDADASPALHARMERLYRTAGTPLMACAHALPRAIAESKNIEAVTAAVRCTGDRERFLSPLSKAEAARAAKLLDAPPSDRELSDQLNVEALWEGDGQVDVVVVTPEGRVVNFTGGARRVSASFVESQSMEKLAVSMEKRGEYQMWVVPRVSNAGRPLQGKVKISSYNASRTLPFAVTHKAQKIATVKLFLDFRLEPVSDMDLVQ